MRKNNLTKLFEDPYPYLQLDAKSVYNLITYSDVLVFILEAIKKCKVGIFNLVSSNNITLETIAEIVSKKTVFGEHHYEVGRIANKKAAEIYPRFNLSSEIVLREFLDKNKTA